MALDHAATEALYDQLADAIDKARTMGEPEAMESLFLAKLAFAALREIDESEKVKHLIELGLRDLDRPDQ
jgi:hypothetical protein